MSDRTIEIFRGILQIWGALLFFASVFEMIRMRNISAERIMTACTAAGTAISFIMDQMLLKNTRILPLWVYPFGFAMLTAAAAATHRAVSLRERYEITPRSVKESFDTLPAGLCFSGSDGLPQMVNPTMESICRELTGNRLSDAAGFRKQLEDNAFTKSVRGGKQPIVRLNDGRAYSFKSYENDMDGELICELIASDITEIFRLTEELNEKRKRSAEINSRLKALNSTIRYVIMEKEILQMKVRIHDELGQALLMAKCSLADRNSVDSSELLRIWRLNIRLLKSESRESWQRPYFVNLQRAALLGIKVDIDGELPEDTALIPIIDTAIAVHTTNVLRHAEGTEANISIKQLEHAYELSFTNNGRPPEYGVKETGGLANLRRKAEEAGGGMKLRALPRFELILRLPKKDDEKEAQ